MPLNPDDMQDRINRLEALVLNLVTEQNQVGGSSSSSQNPMSPIAAARNIMSPNNAQELTPSSTAEQSDAMDGGQPEESETERVTNSLGVMHVHQNKSLYIGNTHWAAVLEDVSYGLDIAGSSQCFVTGMLTLGRSMRSRTTSLSIRSNMKTRCSM